MITIISKTKGLFDYSDPFDEQDGYRVNIEVDGLPLARNVKALDAETNGVWDEAKVRAYLASREVYLLSLAREANVRVSDRILEAPDFRVASPKVSDDLAQVRKDVDIETKKGKKSIAYLALAQAKLIEDLTQRVEKLEQENILNVRFN